MDSVRIDKFLWSIRVYKTRTDATDACKGGKVTVGGAAAKPAREVKAGDVIGIRKGPVSYTYTENLTPQAELDKLHAPVETFFIRRDRGSGRPTKKERRDMDSLYGSFLSDEGGDGDD